MGIFFSRYFRSNTPDANSDFENATLEATSAPQANAAPSANPTAFQDRWEALEVKFREAGLEGGGYSYSNPILSKIT